MSPDGVEVLMSDTKVNAHFFKRKRRDSSLQEKSQQQISYII